MPFVNRETAILRDKVKELEHEVAAKEVETRVITNKYNYLREDYTAMRLGQIVNEREGPVAPNGYRVTDEQIELIKENEALKEKLSRQEKLHLEERADWQLNGFVGNSNEIQQQIRELRAQNVSLQIEKDRITDDREQSETLFKDRITSLEKSL